MQPHQDRVVAEESELAAKLNRLGEFIHGEVFTTLPLEDRELLQEQDDCMRSYLDVLHRRIARFFL